VAPTAVPRRGGEGRVNGAVPDPFDVEEERDTGMEEERGTDVEAHMEEGMQWRWTRRTRMTVCGGEMTGLGLRGLGTLKKKNSSNGHDDVINAVATYELLMFVATVVIPVATD
jgi:hypothetical protein